MFFSRPKNLKSKVVLVTGGGSGIGRYLSIELAKKGANIIIWDIRMNFMEETKAMIEKEVPDAQVHLFECDLSKKDVIYEHSDRLIEQFGFVDIIVNNAGVVSGKSFLECEDALIQRTIDVNILAHMWIAKRFLPLMIERNDGMII